MLGINGEGAEGGYKDTEDNIRETGEFVVNLVDEALAERMNICAVDFPTEIGDLEVAKLTAVPSVGVQAAAHRQIPGQLRMQADYRAVVEQQFNDGSRPASSTSAIRDDLMDMEKLYVKPEASRSASLAACTGTRLVHAHQRSVPNGSHEPTTRISRGAAVRVKAVRKPGLT